MGWPACLLPAGKDRECVMPSCSSAQFTTPSSPPPPLTCSQLETYFRGADQMPIGPDVKQVFYKRVEDVKKRTCEYRRWGSCSMTDRRPALPLNWPAPPSGWWPPAVKSSCGNACGFLFDIELLYHHGQCLPWTALSNLSPLCTCEPPLAPPSRCILALLLPRTKLSFICYVPHQFVLYHVNRASTGRERSLGGPPFPLRACHIPRWPANERSRSDVPSDC